MEIMEIKKHRKNIPKFVCDLCDFKCYLKSDWERHIVRDKHINNENGNKMEIKNIKKNMQKTYQFYKTMIQKIL